MANDLKNKFEVYVATRLHSFASRFAAQHAPQLSDPQIQQAVSEDLLQDPLLPQIVKLIKEYRIAGEEGAGGPTLAFAALPSAEAPAAGTGSVGGEGGGKMGMQGVGASGNVPSGAGINAPGTLAAKLRPQSQPQQASPSPPPVPALTTDGMELTTSAGADVPGGSLTPMMAALTAAAGSQQHPGASSSANEDVDAAAAALGSIRLVFRHECCALGCRDSQCTLCQYNPMRLCDRNFCKKYLVGDVLKAKCSAPIRVELRRKVPAPEVTAAGETAGTVGTGGAGVVVGGSMVGPAPGPLLEEDEFNNVMLEVILLDGVMFKERGGDSRILGEDDLRACFKLNNHKDEPLLQAKPGGTAIGSPPSRRILIKPERGVATLPELTVTDSSEALLTGRKPPFRLLVSAVSVEDTALMMPAYGYAVSEDFVVATRRVKQANKADIPLLDDHVSKIEHIGRETIKKLADLPAAAAELGLNLTIPAGISPSVVSVGQFLALVEAADKDGQLKKMLQMLLKLSREKWEEAAAHAAQAVLSDFRRRLWSPARAPGAPLSIGLLFGCKYGAVQLKDPVSLLHPVSGGGFRVSPEDELDGPALNIVRQLKRQATAAWLIPGHPGWGIFKDAPLVAAPVQAVAAAAGRLAQQPVGTGGRATGAAAVAAGVPLNAGSASLPAPATAQQQLAAASSGLTGLAAALIAAGSGGVGTGPGIRQTSPAPAGMVAGNLNHVTAAATTPVEAAAVVGSLLHHFLAARAQLAAPPLQQQSSPSQQQLAHPTQPTQPTQPFQPQPSQQPPQTAQPQPQPLQIPAQRQHLPQPSDQLPQQLQPPQLLQPQQLQQTQQPAQPLPSAQPTQSQQQLPVVLDLTSEVGAPAAALSGLQYLAMQLRDGGGAAQAGDAAAVAANLGALSVGLQLLQRHSAAGLGPHPQVVKGRPEHQTVAQSTQQPIINPPDDGAAARPAVGVNDSPPQSLAMGTAAAATDAARKSLGGDVGAVKRPRSPSPSPPPSPERTGSVHTATTDGAPTAHLLANLTSNPSLSSCLVSAPGGCQLTRGSTAVMALLPTFTFGPDGRVVLVPSRELTADGSVVLGVDAATVAATQRQQQPLITASTEDGKVETGSCRMGRLMHGEEVTGPSGPEKLESVGDRERNNRDSPRDAGYGPQGGGAADRQNPKIDGEVEGHGRRQRRRLDDGGCGSGNDGLVANGAPHLTRQPTLSMGMGTGANDAPAHHLPVPKAVSLSEIHATPFTTGLPPDLLAAIAAQAESSEQAAARQRAISTAALHRCSEGAGGGSNTGDGGKEAGARKKAGRNAAEDVVGREVITNDQGTGGGDGGGAAGLPGATAAANTAVRPRSGAAAAIAPGKLHDSSGSDNSGTCSPRREDLDLKPYIAGGTRDSAAGVTNAGGAGNLGNHNDAAAAAAAAAAAGLGVADGPLASLGSLELLAFVSSALPHGISNGLELEDQLSPAKDVGAGSARTASGGCSGGNDIGSGGCAPTKSKNVISRISDGTDGEVRRPGPGSQHQSAPPISNGMASLLAAVRAAEDDNQEPVHQLQDEQLHTYHEEDSLPMQPWAAQQQAAMAMALGQLRGRPAMQSLPGGSGRPTLLALQQQLREREKQHQGRRQQHPQQYPQVQSQQTTAAAAASAAAAAGIHSMWADMIGSGFPARGGTANSWGAEPISLEMIAALQSANATGFGGFPAGPVFHMGNGAFPVPAAPSSHHGTAHDPANGYHGALTAFSQSLPSGTTVNVGEHDGHFSGGNAGGLGPMWSAAEAAFYHRRSEAMPRMAGMAGGAEELGRWTGGRAGAGHQPPSAVWQRPGFATCQVDGISGGDGDEDMDEDMDGVGVGTGRSRGRPRGRGRGRGRGR